MIRPEAPWPKSDIIEAGKKRKWWRKNGKKLLKNQVGPSITAILNVSMLDALFPPFW